MSVFMMEPKIEKLNDRTFANSLQGEQQQLAEYNEYRTQEKPPKFDEKGELEVLLFTLQSAMRANNQPPFVLREGKLIGDINRAWNTLEKVEHERELALKDELIRQAKLEQLAARFNRKADMRETWLTENQRLVSQDNLGSDLASVEAYFYPVSPEKLEAENFHGIEKINNRKENVLKLWNYLFQLLLARRVCLELSMAIQRIFRDMLLTLDIMDDIKMWKTCSRSTPFWNPASISLANECGMLWRRLSGTKSSLIWLHNASAVSKTTAGCASSGGMWLTWKTTSRIKNKDIRERLDPTIRREAELENLTQLRKQRLIDALSDK